MKSLLSRGSKHRLSVKITQSGFLERDELLSTAKPEDSNKEKEEKYNLLYFTKKEREERQRTLTISRAGSTHYHLGHGLRPQVEQGPQKNYQL